MPIDYDITMPFVKYSFLNDFSKKVEKLGYCLTARDAKINGKDTIIASAEYISLKQFIWKDRSPATKKKLETLIGREYKYIVAHHMNKDVFEIFPVKINYFNSNPNGANLK